MGKFILGFALGVVSVLAFQFMTVWEVKAPPGSPPDIKVKVEVKEPKLYELMLLMPDRK